MEVSFKVQWKLVEKLDEQTEQYVEPLLLEQPLVEKENSENSLCAQLPWLTYRLKDGD